MPCFSAADSEHMARALRLALRGRYSARPNPIVGCVLVRDGSVVGEGWHALAGEAHAEINALRDAGDARHATAYVTLEPCAHHGRTPPCTDALISAGVAEVVFALSDLDASVEGNGGQRLIDAGIRVRSGLMRDAAAAQNRGYLSRVERGRPFVRLKMAASLDGAIAMRSGESRWITGSASRDDVHRLRAESSAVLTGVGTVLADNPTLNVRRTDLPTEGLQPIRAIVDSKLRTPPAAKVLTTPGETILYCRDESRRAELEAAGAAVVCSAGSRRVAMPDVLTDLGRRNVNLLLVESGPELAGSLLTEGLVDELVIYQSPHIMGSETRGLFRTPGWRALADRQALAITDIRRIGNDLRITARPVPA